jgi:hypothetical protein
MGHNSLIICDGDIMAKKKSQRGRQVDRPSHFTVMPRDRRLVRLEVERDGEPRLLDAYFRMNVHGDWECWADLGLRQAEKFYETMVFTDAMDAMQQVLDMQAHPYTDPTPAGA